jgi:hypothetical protein
MLELEAEFGRAGSSSINMGLANVPNSGTTIESNKAISDYSRDQLGIEQ